MDIDIDIDGDYSTLYAGAEIEGCASNNTEAVEGIPSGHPWPIGPRLSKGLGAEVLAHGAISKTIGAGVFAK
jgi:hypothetical protein